MKKFYVVLAIITISAFYSQFSHACSCGPPSDVDASYKEASVVVFAEAISVKREPTKLSRGSKDFDVTTEIVLWRVKKNWKGQYEPGKTFSTSTVVTCCVCGLPVEKGKSLILYLSGEVPFQLSFCSRNSDPEHSTKDVKRLNKLVKRIRSGI